MIGLITGLLSTAGSIFSSWQERKKVKAIGRVELERTKIAGKIQRERTLAASDAQYNVEVARGMQASWKDELFVIVWLSILVGCFIPWTQPYVKEGFVFLKTNTPVWFEWCLMGMVVASFGLKGWKLWKQ